MATNAPYLSKGFGKYRIISQGMPVTADKASAIDAINCAKTCGVKELSKLAWNGEAGEWQTLSAILATDDKGNGHE